MKASTIKWHLARDNQERLARFCQKHAVRQFTAGKYSVGEASFFQQVYWFGFGQFIRVELRAGDTRGYSVADHFQVVDYSLDA